MKRAKDIDWRSNLVAEVAKDQIVDGKKVTAGTAIYRTTTLIQDSVEVSFPDPSPTALFLSIANKNYQSLRPLYRNVVKPYLNDKFEELFNFFELSISSVVFSFNAVESYANMKIAEDKYYEKKLKSSVYGALSCENIEWLSLDEKIGDVLPQQLNIKTPKGTALWEKYIKLRKLRNKIIHIRKKDQTRSNLYTGMYPKNLWSDLFQTYNDNYPEISKNIILHFEDKNNLPHWLKYNNI